MFTAEKLMRRQFLLTLVVGILGLGLLGCSPQLPEYRTVELDFGNNQVTLDIPSTGRFNINTQLSESAFFGDQYAFRNAGGVLSRNPTEEVDGIIARITQNIKDQPERFHDIKEWQEEVNGQPAQFLSYIKLIYPGNEQNELYYDEYLLIAYIEAAGWTWGIWCDAPADDRSQRRICGRIVNSLKVK